MTNFMKREKDLIAEFQKEMDDYGLEVDNSTGGMFGENCFRHKDRADQRKENADRSVAGKWVHREHVHICGSQNGRALRGFQDLAYFRFVLCGCAQADS